MRSAGGIVKNRVRSLRLEKGLTQTEVADLVGVTRQTIHKIETYDYNPTVRLALDLARVLATEIGQLFWLEQGENEP
jgi:putative transcriptional regulator